jgi:Rod binding domain-containing protein
MSIPTAVPLDPNVQAQRLRRQAQHDGRRGRAAAGAAADDGVDPAYRAKATEAAVKFESFFIGQMLHQMRSGTRELSAEDSVFKDKINQDMLDMADNLVADQMANQRAFGIADVILRQLLPTEHGAGARRRHAGRGPGRRRFDPGGGADCCRIAKFDARRLIRRGKRSPFTVNGPVAVAQTLQATGPSGLHQERPLPYEHQ